jgi:hypothetical protein
MSPVQLHALNVHTSVLPSLRCSTLRRLLRWLLDIQRFRSVIVKSILFFWSGTEYCLAQYSGNIYAVLFAIFWQYFGFFLAM